MNDLEKTKQAVSELEELAAKLRGEKSPKDDSFRSAGAMGDKVAGVRVIRNGQIIQEWHND